MKKIYWFIAILIVFSILIFFGFNQIKDKFWPEKVEVNQDIPVIMDNPELTKSPEEIALITEKALEDEIIPTRHFNKVVFTSQAPYAKWDDLHDEACEEASLIMAHHYLIGTEKLEIKTAEEEIQKMVAFQENYFGSHKDLDAEESIELAEKFYNEKYQLIELESEENSAEKDSVEISENDSEPIVNQEKIDYLKKELSKGNLFIIPAAGQELGNPYFREPGPLYHILVITGYDDDKKEFITNDPGTRRGERYAYSYEVLWNAIHDFPGKKTDILTGAKNVILVEK